MRECSDSLQQRQPLLPAGRVAAPLTPSGHEVGSVLLQVLGHGGKQHPGIEGWIQVWRERDTHTQIEEPQSSTSLATPTHRPVRALKLKEASTTIGYQAV